MTEAIERWSEFVAPLLGGEVVWTQAVLVGMTPLFLLAFVAEWQLGRSGRRPFDFNFGEMLGNLGLAATYQIAEIIAHALVVATVAAWVYQHRLSTVPVNGWTILPIFFAVEFTYYWWHRASHRCRFLWTAHVAHHTGEHMNFSTAARQSMLYSVTGWWLFYLPIVWLGVPPAVVYFLYGVDLAYQYFVHTEAIGHLPRWFEYVFDTPSNHRVHHGRNPQYIDKNFGGVIILFDRWFGTWEAEVEPPVYGIATRQPHTHNVFALNFHEFIDMCRDVRRPGPLWLRLKHLWAAPEWERPTMS